MAWNGADLNWATARRHWPHAEHSRFEHAAGLVWHVQTMGDGPVVLLVHGTGSSTHSWSGLMPLLAARYRVIAADLPGHGFTEPGNARQSSLPGMAAGLAALLNRLDMSPDLVLGHSAGAAVLAQLCLDHGVAPLALVSVNGALLPLGGLAGQFFAPAAKLLSMMPPVPRLLSWRAADRRMVARLVKETGSTPPPAMVDIYHQLIRSPRHVAGTLRMMANWDLAPLSRRLQRLSPTLYLIACDNDRTVPPTEARRLHRQLPASRLTVLPRLGHLGHEEDPERFAELLDGIAVDCGLAGAAG
jgi:magnesium chelatase accessory protein